MEQQAIQENLNTAIKAAVEAGKEILKVYESEFAVEHKDDKSPLTLADKKAHHKIVEVLEATGLPVLSEEGKDIPYEERKDWEYFWIVDPLDGTKEFIKRNGEFTVNIALVHRQKPLAGVIYVPVKDQLYFGINTEGSYLIENTRNADSLSWEELTGKGSRLPVNNGKTAYTVVGSRSHMSKETEDFIEELKKEHGKIEIASMGSSLKICLVAEGKADVYPRFAPTMEWDTAAGQAIAAGAGKQLLDYHSGKEMVYNRENLRNDWFIVK